MSRRRLLSAGAGLLVAATGTWACDRPGARRHIGDALSPARGRAKPSSPVRWQLAVPATADRTPLRVALVLHARGSDERTAFDQLLLDRYLDGAVDAGVPPYALASVDGETRDLRPCAGTGAARQCGPRHSAASGTSGI